ncbi:hypothetical protein KIL84_006172 [Mauremys mutica]|uniref:Uncharacterized protein n=1 Tax=Mauremys mutica TaxID=74926 RepID=A0A9D3WYN8_9SAUR|nr:hypothetical protein KIL84_006172 [Mauremys mutica]
MGLSYVVKLKLLQLCSNWLPSTAAFYIRERTLPYSSLLQNLNWLLVSCSICIFSGCQEKFLEQSLIPENYFGVSEHYRHWNEKNRKECGVRPSYGTLAMPSFHWKEIQQVIKRYSSLTRKQCLS